MARFENRNPLYLIGGLIAALLIVYFLFQAGYLGGSRGDLSPPTSTPRMP